MAASPEIARTDLSLPPPFVAVEGLINFRRVGGYFSSFPSLKVKPVLLYRSGETTHITALGQQQLVALGVRKVFDLRSNGEVSYFQSQTSPIEGVDIIHIPVNREADLQHERLAAFLKRFEENELEAFMQEYSEVLPLSAPALEIIIRQLTSKPDEPCLVHCTAGKDRTGLVVAVLLMILGVSDEDIIQDYGLTTAGLAPFTSMFAERFLKREAFRNNLQGTLNMGSSRPETMLATLQMIREKFGGAESYLKANTNITDKDIQTFREKMLVPYSE